MGNSPSFRVASRLAKTSSQAWNLLVITAINFHWFLEIQFWFFFVSMLQYKFHAHESCLYKLKVLLFFANLTQPIIPAHVFFKLIYGFSWLYKCLYSFVNWNRYTYFQLLLFLPLLNFIDKIYNYKYKFVQKRNIIPKYTK